MVKALSRIGLTLLLAVAVPATAAAGSAPELRCPERSCGYTIAGGGIELRFGPSEIKCLWTTGHGAFETKTTALTVVEFHQCREQMTAFKFGCVGKAQASGAIMTNRLGSHLMVGGGGRPIIQLTGLRASFVCAGFVPFFVEGFFVEQVRASGCNTASRNHVLEATLIAHGRQSPAPFYDVYLDHRDDTYAVDAPWLMTFQQPVAFSC